VENDPNNELDPFGLLLYRCTRQSKPSKNWTHAYLWNSRDAETCGRGGFSMAGPNGKQEKGPFDENPPYCEPVKDSEGKENLAMNCCKRVAFSPWFPFLNDCHTWIDDCLMKWGLEPPYYGFHKTLPSP
jgi:hypothetical protein